MNIMIQISRFKTFYTENGILITIKKIIAKIKNKIGYKSEPIKFVTKEQQNYKSWIKKNEPNEKELEKQKAHKFEYEPKISIIVPMYETKEKYLKELIDSLISQTYWNWELCLADGSNTKKQYVELLVSKDKRIKYKFLNENKGISENSNEALKLATGEYIAMLDHDDIIPAFSLYEIVKTINANKDVEFIYTDEDKILEEKEIRILPHFKPDYAPDNLLSYNYICHFLILKKQLMEKLGGFKKEFDGSQDYDLILRATECTSKIIHIPKILYHWRINEDSVASDWQTKTYAYNAGKRAIEEHLKRMNIKANVEETQTKGIYKINYDIEGTPKISIIVNSKDDKYLQRCITNILNKTTYQNYEIIVVHTSKNKEVILPKEIKVIDSVGNYSKNNNQAVKNSIGDYIVFIDSAIEIITPNWLEIMLGNLQRQEVGIVSGKILYKNFNIMHTGIILGCNGLIGYVNRGMYANIPGYMSRNIITQNFNAITGAMLIISKADYEAVDGLDENFSEDYSNVDLCLKIRNKGKVVVMNPYILAYCLKKQRKYKETKKSKLLENSQKLLDKWKSFCSKSDQYFNPNFNNNIKYMKIKYSIKK